MGHTQVDIPGADGSLPIRHGVGGFTTNFIHSFTRVIELVRPGIARSRVCAPPHAHIDSQGSRPSLCGVHNVEVLGASGTKKSRFGAWKVKSLVLAEFKLRRNAPSTHTLRWRSVRRVRVAHEPVLSQGGGRGTLEGASNGRHSYETDF